MFHRIPLSSQVGRCVGRFAGTRKANFSTASTDAAKNLPRVDPMDPSVKRKNIILGASLAGFVTSIFFLTMHRMNVNTEEELGEDFSRRLEQASLLLAPKRRDFVGSSNIMFIVLRETKAKSANCIHIFRLRIRDRN